MPSFRQIRAMGGLSGSCVVVVLVLAGTGWVRLRLVGLVRVVTALPGGAGLREVPGRRIAGRQQVHGLAAAAESLSKAGVGGSPARWCSRGRSLAGEPGAGGAPACGFGELDGAVHTCTRDRRRGWPGVRTYGGQRCCSGHRQVAFAHVTGYAEVEAGAGCKTVGSAYVGSNPTPATHLRRSEPVTLNCVTGFCVQNERLRKPSALFRGLCVGWIRSSPGRCGYRLRCLLSCGNASGGGCLRAVVRARQARWPWAMRGTGDRFAYR